MRQMTMIDKNPEILRYVSPDSIMNEYFGDFIFSPNPVKYHILLYQLETGDLFKLLNRIEFEIDWWCDNKNHEDSCRVNDKGFKEVFAKLNNPEIYAREHCDCNYFNTISSLASHHSIVTRMIAHRNGNPDYCDGKYAVDPPNNPNAGIWHEGYAWKESVVNDCAAQAIGHLVLDYPEANISYDEVAHVMTTYKSSDWIPEEFKTKKEKEEWLSHHTSATQSVILDTLDDFMIEEYIIVSLRMKYTVAEVAIMNQRIQRMIVDSPNHVTAVKYGEIFDIRDPSDSTSNAVYIPASNYKKLKGTYDL